MRRKRVVLIVGGMDADPVQAFAGWDPSRHAVRAAISAAALEHAGVAREGIVRGTPVYCRGSRYFVRDTRNPGGRGETLELDLVERDPLIPPEPVDEASLEELFEDRSAVALEQEDRSGEDEREGGE